MDNIQELVEQIRNFEIEAGESFTDYFMHDRVKALSWSFWLLGKGYKEHALNIIKGLEKGETYFDQEVLFDIYPEYIYEEENNNHKWDETAHDKNVEIWAEFLLATPSYVERVNEFFNKFFSNNEY